MKREIVFLIFVFLLPFLNYGQQGKDVAMPKTYLFDHFVKGSVLSKSGAIDEAPLNYNSEDQSIIFFRDGQHFILTNLQTIDTIYIKDRKFIPLGNIVYEVLASSAPVSLLVTYHSKTRPMTAISNHDSTSKKVSNQVSNTITDVYVTRPFNGDNLVEIQKRYWLNQGRNIYKANTEKQFIKVFSVNSDVIKNYIKDDKIDFSNIDDLLKLLAFSNSLATLSSIK